MAKRHTAYQTVLTGYRPENAALLFSWNWSELHRRLAIARKHNLFSALRLLDEFGEVGLGVMDIDLHPAILANQIS